MYYEGLQWQKSVLSCLLRGMVEAVEQTLETRNGWGGGAPLSHVSHPEPYSRHPIQFPPPLPVTGIFECRCVHGNGNRLIEMG
jgi:hypothetical protein